MSRRGEMPAEVVSLQRLYKELEARRQSHRDRMESGLEEKEYLKHVGRAAEVKWLMETIKKSLANWGEDGEG